MHSRIAIRSTLIAAAFLLLTAGSALAQTGDPRVNALQTQQKDRIVHAVGKRELTANETLRLADEQRAIKTQERRYKSDGVLTVAERANSSRRKGRLASISPRKNTMRSAANVYPFNEEPRAVAIGSVNGAAPDRRSISAACT